LACLPFPPPLSSCPFARARAFPLFSVSAAARTLCSPLACLRLGLLPGAPLSSVLSFCPFSLTHLSGSPLLSARPGFPLVYFRLPLFAYGPCGRVWSALSVGCAPSYFVAPLRAPPFSSNPSVLLSSLVLFFLAFSTPIAVSYLSACLLPLVASLVFSPSRGPRSLFSASALLVPAILFAPPPPLPQLFGPSPRLPSLVPDVAFMAVPPSFALLLPVLRSFFCSGFLCDGLLICWPLPSPRRSCCAAGPVLLLLCSLRLFSRCSCLSPFPFSVCSVFASWLPSRRLLGPLRLPSCLCLFWLSRSLPAFSSACRLLSAWFFRSPGYHLPLSLLYSPRAL